MGLDKFEKAIQENREFFEKEPSMEHMDKFLYKLKESSNNNSLSASYENKTWWIGIAATLLILVSMGWFIQMQAGKMNQKQEQFLSAELIEVKSYYTFESQKMLKEITECSTSSPAKKVVLESTQNQLQKMNFNAEKLENKLKEASGNKKLELAYIQSLKAQNDLVNQVYNEICKPTQNMLTQ
jgi:hypothetical protein